MQANSKSLKLVLASAARFIIPEYQRPYCWTKEEITQLWNDLEGAYEDYRKKKEPKEGEDYFLGPIVVANQKDNDGSVLAHVVDGQQRLTTVYSMLWCFKNQLKCYDSSPEIKNKISEIERLLTTPSGLSTLAVAKDDQANFQVMKEDMGALDLQKELGVAGQFLKDQISKLKDENYLFGFINYILNLTVFILVETESYSSAWELFIGLNGKGRPLTPSDLIKAYICGTNIDSSATANIWNERILPLGNDATSAISDITRMGTGGLVSEAKLFKIFEIAWNNKKVTMAALSAGAKSYELFWKMSIDKISDLPNNGRRFLRGLRSLDRRDHTPILLAIATKYGYPSIFENNLLELLEGYQLWMAIRGKRVRERDFAELANEILLTDALTKEGAFTKLCEKIKALAPPIEEVRYAVSTSAYRGRVMLFIVRSYEEGMRGDVVIDDVWYEHLIPQTPTAYWSQIVGTSDPNEYSKIVNNIGNICPLDYSTNIKVGNDDWNTKCKLYIKEVPNWLLATIARENPDGWTTIKIKKRAEEIADWAVNTRWNLNGSLSKFL